MFCQCCANEEDGNNVMIIADQASPGTREVEEEEEEEDRRPHAVVNYGVFDDPDDVEPLPPPPAPMEQASSEPSAALLPVVKPSPGDPSFPKTRDFVVQIDKQGGSMGIDISAHDGKTLLVGRIKDGGIDRWNQHAGQSYERVRRGDRIIECNSSGDNSDTILQALKSNDRLELRIRRVTEFRVAFVCKGKVLGIDTLGLEADLNREDKLIVKEVLDGPLRDLNKKNKADLEIGKGDEIAEVNGTTGDAKTLLDILQKVGPMQVLIRRPSC